MFVDGSGAVTGQHVVPESQLGQGLRVAVQGPDGALYVATGADAGAIWRVTAA